MNLVKVGAHLLRWENLPSESESKGRVFDEVSKSWLDIAWKVDGHGVQLWLEGKAIEFDISSRKDDDGRSVYDLSERSNGRSWQNIRIGQDEALAEGLKGAGSKRARVRCQMPGRVIRVLVKQGETVVKGQSLLVLEAMKMENEIRALVDGTVTEIKVAEGQTVESGAELLILNG